MDDPKTIYIASQPSIIRQALATIPNPQHCHFLDLGCGKGRALLVATEFRFAAIIGVDLSPTLSRTARRNADVFSRVHPDRTPIAVVTCDALAYELPAEKLVIFLYNPFHRPLIVQLLHRIESSLQAIRRELYIVYYNPVWADVFDASAALERRFAAQLPYDQSEIGYGPDESDVVVVWQNRGNSHRRPPGPHTAPVSVVTPGWRAEIARIGMPQPTQSAARSERSEIFLRIGLTSGRSDGYVMSSDVTAASLSLMTSLAVARQGAGYSDRAFWRPIASDRPLSVGPQTVVASPHQSPAPGFGEKNWNFSGFPSQSLRVGRRWLFYRNVWPDFREFGIQPQPFL